MTCDAWIWMGDPKEDDLASMGNEMVVHITAGQLRELLRNKGAIHPSRALRIIEGLLLRRDPEAPSMSPGLRKDDLEDEIFDRRTPDEKLMCTIYTVAHAGGDHDCQDKHPGFATRALEVERELVEGRTIPEWKDE
jgi:hypothetical protein